MIHLGDDVILRGLPRALRTRASQPVFKKGMSAVHPTPAHPKRQVKLKPCTLFGRWVVPTARERASSIQDFKTENETKKKKVSTNSLKMRRF